MTAEWWRCRPVSIRARPTLVTCSTVQYSTVQYSTVQYRPVYRHLLLQLAVGGGAPVPGDEVTRPHGHHLGVSLGYLEHDARYKSPCYSLESEQFTMLPFPGQWLGRRHQEITHSLGAD